jgi:hypothetical protein
MMPLGTPQQVSALRAQLWDAGFRPVPVYSPDAKHESAGKAPKGQDWGNAARQDPPRGAVEAAHADALNTGILCDGLRAIDIDIDNPTVAATIKARALDMFGETAMRYRGNSARVLLLYRAAEGIPPKRAIAGHFGKVEILGKGQQFVGFGVHPSGADLQWLPDTPGEISATDLPAITEEAITAFLTACAPTIGAKAEAPQQAERQTNAKLGADALQVVAALSGIPNNGPADWETWNRIGMATWAATGGGEAGRAAFHAWSEQHPSYDAAITNERWDHYRDSPPTQIGAGTLFYLAKQHRQTNDGPPDWEPPPWEPPAEEYGAGPDIEPPHMEPAPTDERIPILYWDQIGPSLDAADFVEGLLLEAAMSVVYGQSNSGKTFFVADLALHIAAGKPWNGKEVEQGGVIWLAMEGAFGISNRIAAWRKEHGLEGQNIPFAVVPVALNLLHPDGDTGPLIAAIKVAAERLGMPVRLVVVDTLSRAIAGGNENAPDDMGALVTNGTKIQQKVNAHVIWIHHSGKDEAKGARGHSLLRAATDTEIEITAEGPNRVARVTKQRELDCSGEFGFTLRIVELGKNRRGKPVTSCVVDYSNGMVRARPRIHLDGHKKRAFEVLIDTIASNGRQGDPGVPSGYPSVPEKWWRDRFYDAAMPGAEQDTKKKAFGRASSDLVTDHVVGMSMGRVWIISEWKDNENEGE